MRVLILSDIHSNLEALTAVLDAAPAHDAVWNLGDVVGYGANPNEVIDRVQGLGTVFVRGNHDRVCCGLTGLDEFNPIAGHAARWTRSMLSADHCDWLRQMPSGPILPDGDSVSCMHGSVLDEDEYVMTVRDAWMPLRTAREREISGEPGLGGTAARRRLARRLCDFRRHRESADVLPRALRREAGAAGDSGCGIAGSAGCAAAGRALSTAASGGEQPQGRWMGRIVRVIS
jgi:predicted phosphodiesterase